MCQADVTYESVLVAELFVTQRALERSVRTRLRRGLSDQRNLVRCQLGWLWGWRRTTTTDGNRHVTGCKLQKAKYWISYRNVHALPMYCTNYSTHDVVATSPCVQRVKTEGKKTNNRTHKRYKVVPSSCMQGIIFFWSTETVNGYRYRMVSQRCI